MKIKKHIRISLFLIFFIQQTSLLSQSISGLLGGTATVCAGNNSGVLFLSGFNGSVIRWEVAPSNSGPWATLAYNSTNYYYTNLPQTTWFRAVTQYSLFAEATSNSVRVLCQPSSTITTISAPTLQCIATIGSVSITSSQNMQALWEYSTNNWITTLAFGTPYSSISALPTSTVPYKIRAFLKDAICPAYFSNTIAVYPAAQSTAGSISGPSLVCSNSAITTLSLTSFLGTILKWETAITNSGPYSTVPGSSGITNLPISNSSQNTFYRSVVQNGNCPSDTSAIHIVSVSPLTVGGFISGPNSLCAGQNSTTLNLIGYTGTINQWQFSNNSGLTWTPITNTLNFLPQSNILTNRIYRAQIQSGICPAQFSSNYTLTINPLPICSFSTTNTCQNSQAVFTPTLQNITALFWDFGDGTSSASYNPSHSFASAGTYTVRALGISSLGCTDSVKQFITIYPQPQVAFLTSNSVCLGSGAPFVNTSSISVGSIQSYTFSFGDNTSNSNQVNFTHLYSAANIYTINLSAVSNNGCISNSTQTLIVHSVPNAQFNYANHCLGNIAPLQNLSTISSGNLSYTWHFGNGDSTQVVQPNYQFQTAGNYNIKLFVKSDFNCSNQIIKPISVHPLASISLSLNDGCALSPIQLSGTILPTNSIQSSTLNLGDGSSTNNFPTSHIYNLPGIFQIQIIAKTDSGCVSSLSRPIQIHPNPKTNFITNGTCQFEKIICTNLTALSSGTFQNLWKINDLDTFIQSNPAFTFTSFGAHSVKLITTSEFQCKDSLEKQVQISVNPLPDFFASESACQYSPIQLANNSEANLAIVNYFWNFGDNTSSSQSSPTKKYVSAGKYTMSLTSTTDKGCSSSLSKSIEIFPQPKANFKSDLICSKSVFDITNKTSIDAGQYSSSWLIDDTLLDEIALRKFQFENAGLHKIKLIVTSNERCMDSLEEILRVYPPPILKFLADTLMNLGEEQLIHVQGAFSYTWSPPDFLTDPFSDKTFCQPSRSMHYLVSATTADGCSSSDSLYIRVMPSYQLEISNVLSPDNNGLNDTWYIKNIEAYPDNEVLLFDQWNQIILKQKSYKNDWGGKNAQGVLLPPAVYFYQISFEGSDIKYQGALNLVLTD